VSIEASCCVPVYLIWHRVKKFTTAPIESDETKELLGLVRCRCIAGNHGIGVLVALIAHVVGIGADAVTAADHRLFVQAVSDTDARTEVLFTGGGTGIPRLAAFAADVNVIRRRIETNRAVVIVRIERIGANVRLRGGRL
jgi:hypothetical protein